MPGNKKINRRAESPPALSSLKHVPAIPESMSSVQNSNPIELDSSEVVFGKKVEYIDACDTEENFSEVVSEKEIKDFAAIDVLELSDCMLLETTKVCFEALERSDFMLFILTCVDLLSSFVILIMIVKLRLLFSYRLHRFFYRLLSQKT